MLEKATRSIRPSSACSEQGWAGVKQQAKSNQYPLGKINRVVNSWLIEAQESMSGKLAKVHGEQLRQWCMEAGSTRCKQAVLRCLQERSNKQLELV